MAERVSDALPAAEPADAAAGAPTAQPYPVSEHAAASADPAASVAAGAADWGCGTEPRAAVTPGGASTGGGAVDSLLAQPLPTRRGEIYASARSLPFVAAWVIGATAWGGMMLAVSLRLLWLLPLATGVVDAQPAEAVAVAAATEVVASELAASAEGGMVAAAVEAAAVGDADAVCVADHAPCGHLALRTPPALPVRPARTWPPPAATGPSSAEPPAADGGAPGSGLFGPRGGARARHAAGGRREYAYDHATLPHAAARRTLLLVVPCRECAPRCPGDVHRTGSPSAPLIDAVF